MKDKEFLIWLYNRLVNIHGESKYYDYIYKLVSIINAMDEDQETPNVDYAIKVFKKETNALEEYKQPKLAFSIEARRNGLSWAVYLNGSMITETQFPGHAETIASNLSSALQKIHWRK